MPAQLSYLDLLRARRTARTKKRILPDAVAEFQGRPLLYLLDASTKAAAGSQIRDLQLLLANRGEHAWVAVVQPGQMTVYPINLDATQLDSAQPDIITVTDPRWSAPLPEFGFEYTLPSRYAGESDYVLR